jgi:hypothetical protein
MTSFMKMVHIFAVKIMLHYFHPGASLMLVVVGQHLMIAFPVR